MRSLFLSVVVLALFCFPVLAADGVVDVKSSHDVATTADRLESALSSKGLTIFARIDHSAGAKSVGLELRPTVLLIFGNPKAGTPLMQCQQSVAIDLPQKALIWEDADGQAWLTYNDPQYLAKRHKVDSCAEKTLQKVAGILANFSKAATGP